MNYAEDACRFACAEETLYGIIARPEQPGDLGVVIVVGGPQTRVGSHRQFVLLSRALAVAGYPTLRFDYRGMGDSTGDQRSFESVTTDIRAAIDKLQTACPSVTRIVLWGLCDAAAAALLYWDETRDPRIGGLCLLNPWVRSAATLAKTQVKHYYGRRLLQGEFWKKLLTGRLNVLRAVAELLSKFGQAARKAPANEHPGFQERMARGWQSFPGRILLTLSGDDYTAKEFLEYAAGAASWRGLLERPNVSRVDIAAADHTFSSSKWRAAAALATAEWLRVLLDV